MAPAAVLAAVPAAAAVPPNLLAHPIAVDNPFDSVPTVETVPPIALPLTPTAIPIAVILTIELSVSSSISLMTSVTLLTIPINLSIIGIAASPKSIKLFFNSFNDR